MSELNTFLALIWLGCITLWGVSLHLEKKEKLMDNK